MRSDDDEKKYLEFKGRVFGDVLHDMIYASGGDQYAFGKQTGINNVMLSNFIKHKKYPGLVSLHKISQVLPREQQEEFVLYFHNPEVRIMCGRELKKRGITIPYSYTYYDKRRSYTGMFEEVDEHILGTLQLQGLFKYLTGEEKKALKSMITGYIVNRNKEMRKMKLLSEAGETDAV